MDSKTNSIFEFIDECLRVGIGKMFKSKPAMESKVLKKLNEEFKVALIELSECKLGGIGHLSCQLYEAINYKFGQSNRHQKFWKTALRVYRLLRKLNQQNLAEPFYRFSQRQEKSGCSYQPTKKGCLRLKVIRLDYIMRFFTAMCYLGALLLRRLSLLDKLLFLSGRSADSSMGYIELRHMLTFNLMSVAMLSEIASQASRQMLQLADIYLGLSVWFRKYSKRFPSTMDALQQSLMQHVIIGSSKNSSKFLKEHDLAIICREIGGAEERANESSNVIRSHSHWTICQSKQKKRKKSGYGLKRN